MNNYLKTGILLIITVFCIPGISAEEIETVSDAKLQILYSSSIKSQVDRYIEEFSNQYPDITIKTIPLNNTTEIVDFVLSGGVEYNIIMVPDYTLLEKNLMPDYHSWDIRYGHCRMVLTYIDDSAYAQNTTSENWFEILAEEGVSWAMIDPSTDSRGWRSLISIGLADSYYERPVFESLVDPATNISREETGETDIITAINPKQAGNLHFEGTMNELVSHLKEGTYDYAWMYQGGAYQNNLSWITLPEEIDLSSSRYEDRYNAISVRTQSGIRQSPPIVFSISIPDNAKNRGIAIDFIKMVISPQEDGVLARLGQEQLIPAEGYGMIPADLAGYIHPF